MLKFNSFLSEAAVVDKLIADLNKIGYTKHKLQTRNLVLVYVPKSDRDISLDDVAKKLNGKRDKSPVVQRRVSSAGAVVFDSGPYSGLMVGVKPDTSKGLNTDEQETLAGIFLATIMHKPTTTFDYSDLKSFGDNNTSSRFRIDQLYEKAGKGWINSSTVIAQTFYPYIRGKKLQVHQRSRSAFVTNISTAAAALVKESGKRLQLDKWNPADIWLVDRTLEGTDFSKFGSILDLNTFLLDQFDKKNIIGVSLKQVGKTAEVSVFNKETRPVIQYTGFDTGKTGFVTALNGTIYYNQGSIVIRNFGRPESVSAEINGKLAQGGKTGAGPLRNIIQDIYSKFDTMTHQEIIALYENDQNKYYNELYAKMRKLDPESAGKYSLDDFMSAIEAKDNKNNYLISKWQVSDILMAINSMTTAQKNEVVSDIISYASSSLAISSVFYKVS
jgi:hypothetical protein